MATVSPVDAFEALVAQARDQLSAREGAPVSWREVVRRAGFLDVDYGRVSYHLLPRRRQRGHHVPAWLIDALVPVFQGLVTRVELNRAAAEAAGYQLGEHHGNGNAGASEAEQLVPMVLRVLGDKDMTDEQRQRLGLDVIGVIMRTIDQERPPT